MRQDVIHIIWDCRAARELWRRFLGDELVAQLDSLSFADWWTVYLTCFKKRRVGDWCWPLLFSTVLADMELEE